MSKRERLEDAGRWLREQRERRGLSVREFAARLDVSTPVVYDWQNGKNAVGDERAEQIAEVLGVDLIDVRRGLGLWVPPKEDQTTSEPASSEDMTAVDEEELYQRLLRLPPLQLQTVYEVVRAMTPDYDDEGEEIHHRE